MNTNDRVHIIKRGDGWAVKREGASKAAKVYDTKIEAQSASGKYTKSGIDVIVHKEDGTIQEWRKANN